ncbi:MAG: peptidylprolyl isomerase [Burkholderiales bacterium]|nr:peptidylprolyl isomerase [Burkholderiales bacterium]
MSTSTSASVGCGSGSCQCAATAAALSSPVPSINGIALFEQGQNPPPEAVQELAYAELLRQEAVKAGLLPRHKGLTAPELNDAERQIVETMVDGAVATPQPTEEECQRYFDANKAQFVVGQALHLRHILFAVTPGVNVQALATHAEKALLELLHKDAPTGRFEQLAAELSNCPSSTQGGDLGWVGPDDCAPELARELFHQSHAQRGNGVHTKLVHSRFGFHIIEVMGRRDGEQKSYADVRERIAAQLLLQSRSKALRQYMSLLVGQALVEGIELEGADSPLVQ